jgi:predicted SnoaL-like aldol condensation-catalyzing enzyme
MTRTIEDRNKALLVLEAFETLVQHEGLCHSREVWSSNYIQHSAHIPPGRDGLFSLVKGAPATMNMRTV